MDTRLKKSVFLSLKQFVPVTFITVAAEIACIFLRRTLPFNFDAVLFAAAKEKKRDNSKNNTYPLIKV